MEALLFTPDPWNNENVALAVPFIAVSFFTTAFFVVTFSLGFFFVDFLEIFPPPTPAMLNDCDFFIAPFDACFFRVFDGTGSLELDPNMDRVGDFFCGLGEGVETDVDLNRESVGDRSGADGADWGWDFIASVFVGADPNKVNVGDFFGAEASTSGVDCCVLTGLEPGKEPKIDNVGDLLSGPGNTCDDSDAAWENTGVMEVSFAFCSAAAFACMAFCSAARCFASAASLRASAAACRS